MENVVGKKITEFRKKNKMTQHEFADKLYVTNTTVSRWETGATIPSAEQLLSIAELLGESIDSLMGKESLKPQAKDDAVAPENSNNEKRESNLSSKDRERILIFKVAGFSLLGVLAVCLIVFAAVSINRYMKKQEELAKEEALWQKTKKFEAEWADLQAISASLDFFGNVENTEYASNGQCIAQFGIESNPVNFEIYSSKQTTAKMYIAVVSKYSESFGTYAMTFFDKVWNLYVNPTELQLANKEFLKTNAIYVSTEEEKTWYAFVEVPVEVQLQEGLNVIKFIVPATGNGYYGLNMDYIRFETDAELKWRPVKDNKVRPADEE